MELRFFVIFYRYEIEQLEGEGRRDEPVFSMR